MMRRLRRGQAALTPECYGQSEKMAKIEIARLGVASR
jgi:hypothetical protein